MKRSAIAIWHGTGKEGKGEITSQSSALNNAPYAWNTRFAQEPGTNPEELIAAAHAGCFTMKLSFVLSEAGYSSETIETTATITLEGSELIQADLNVKAKVPGISKEYFTECVNKAKNECPVSKALNMKITVESTLL